MTLTIKPLHPLFAAEVSGVDLKKPVSPSVFKEIIDAMDTYAVCVYRGQNLTDEEHIEFSRNFGLLEKRTMAGKDAHHMRFKYPELFDAGNVDKDGKILQEDDRYRAYSRGNRLWHTDSSFKDPRSSYSLLLAHIIPPSDADTEFADMRAAYDALPDAMKAKIANLVAEHSILHSRKLGGYQKPTEAEKAELPPVRHRLVHTHPGSGRKTLYLAAHASGIEGMSEEEGQALIDELIKLATKPDFVYRHKWQKGDLLIWDNRCTMHRATPFDDLKYPRDLRRTTVREAA